MGDISYRTHGLHFLPFLRAGGVDAVEREFGDGRAPSFCRPSIGRRGDDGYVPGVRHITQDWLQNLRPLQGARARGLDGPLTSPRALCQPAAAADREPN